MKVTIPTSSLLSVLGPCAEITDRRSSFFFSTCVLLRVTGDNLVVTSYNQPLSVRAQAACEASTDGSVCVPADELLARIRAMPDEKVVLSDDGSKLTIKGAASSRKHVLRCYAGKDFPAFPARPINEIALPGDKLASVLRGVAYASAKNDGAFSPMFHGVALVAANDTLVATASNSHRIARASEAFEGNITTFVPIDAARSLASILTKAEVGVASNDEIVMFTTESVALAYARPSHDGPPFDGVFAALKAVDGPMVGRVELISCIRGVTPDGTSGTAPVEIRSTGSSIVVRHTPALGEDSEDTIEVASAHKWSVKAEARYLLDALANLEGDTVELCAYEKDLNQPIVIRSKKGIATVARVDPKAAA